jgi:hypothetical protein
MGIEAEEVERDILRRKIDDEEAVLDRPLLGGPF